MIENINKKAPLIKQMHAFRQDIHAHPELAFEEIRTAQKVLDILMTLNMNDIQSGIGKTGIVAVLKGNNPESKHIGLRADMDALPMNEKNTCLHSSCYPNKMHACGHDGHLTMLLTAAIWLSERKDFEGTLYFIFQPAEENEGGARAMLDENFLQRFPLTEIYGLHNWPGIESGNFVVHPGPVMASMDIFDITITGKGGHAGIPNTCKDPVVASAQLVCALQSIVSRNISPFEQGVISVTQLNGGDSSNIIPNKMFARGTVRTFSTKVQQQIIDAMQRVCDGIAITFDMDISLNYQKCFPATINTATHAKKCEAAAKLVVGNELVHTNLPPSMGAEDFSLFLQEIPGAYIWIGNGEKSSSLHSSEYDFNDDLICNGANYWIQLAQTGIIN